MRPVLRVWVPTNRAYESARNWGKPRGMDGLNEIVGYNRANRAYGARKEKENLEHVAKFVDREMRRIGYARMTELDRQLCNVYVTIVEPNDRRDVPNVYGGVLKYTLDALTARNKHGVGAIWDDSTQWMPKLTVSIRVDPENVGVAITVIPLEERA